MGHKFIDKMMKTKELLSLCTQVSLEGKENMPFDTVLVREIPHGNKWLCDMCGNPIGESGLYLEFRNFHYGGNAPICHIYCISESIIDELVRLAILKHENIIKSHKADITRLQDFINNE